MTTPISVGLVGTGRAGWGMHCPELDQRPEQFTLVAACDTAPDRRERIAARYGIPTYERIEDLLTDPQVELVDIATRSCDHAAHALLALAAGKHVNIEKPMTATHAEALQVAEAAKKSRGKLFVRHNRRFDPDFLQVQQIMASGLLGKVYEIRLARHGYARRDDWQTLKQFAGGQLLNWGPHIIDHALRFINGPVAEQFSYLARVAAVGDAEDHVKIVLKGENGLVVDLEISGGVALGEPTYRVFGSRGSLTLAGDEIRLKYLDPAQELPARLPEPGNPGAHFGTPESLPWLEETRPIQPGNNTILWDFIYRDVRLGEPYPIRLNEALEVMRVASAARLGSAFELV
jgi:predicted dehydrogenase